MSDTVAVLLLAIGACWLGIAVLFGAWVFTKHVLLEAPVYRHEAYPLLQFLAGIALAGAVFAAVGWWVHA